jgi:hypothetical protein
MIIRVTYILTMSNLVGGDILTGHMYRSIGWRDERDSILFQALRAGQAAASMMCSVTGMQSRPVDSCRFD